MQTIPQLIDAALHSPKAAALAMIVDVEGSAYRKEGAWLLLQEDGGRIGVISGGCIENDLQHRAERLFRTGQAETARYDLSAEDDAGWGRGAGCNGILTVVIRDVDERFKALLHFMQRCLALNEPVSFTQSMTDLQQYNCTAKNGEVFCGESIQRSFSRQNSEPFQTSARIETDGRDLYYGQLIWPQPKLYIIGAGADSRPLAQLAGSIGYAVHIIDWRQHLCINAHFPNAASVRAGNIQQLLSSVHFSKLDAVVIMTHDFQLDQMLVQHFSQFNVLYIGVLGSKKRIQRLLASGGSAAIRSPVGLSIGADGPAEIAVSIAAELIAVRRGKMA